jgi:hypothetical protein
MQEEIGLTAGKIWHAVNSKNELSLTQVKKAVGNKTPVFDWAVGWLAREDKIVITPEKRSFRLCLKDTKGRPVGAS